MRYVLFLFLLFFLVSCHEGSSSGNTDSGIKNTLPANELKKNAVLPLPDSIEADARKRIQVIPIGDINGDGIPDTATVYPPYFNTPSDPVTGGCRGDCFCRVRFSCLLPELDSLLGIGAAALANVGDLDNNGTCEIAFIPDWFQSMWQGLTVYGFKNKHWKRFGSVSVYTEYLMDEQNVATYFRERVKKRDNQHFILVGDSLNADPGGKDTSFTVLHPVTFTIP